jgi:hypothetical protein
VREEVVMQTESELFRYAMNGQVKGRSESYPIWPEILEAVSRHIKDEPSVVRLAGGTDEELFNCDKDTIKACKLGSLIARVVGKPVRAQFVKKDENVKRGKVDGALLAAARRAALIWDTKDEVKMPYEITDEGEILYHNSQLGHQEERRDRWLASTDQILLTID